MLQTYASKDCWKNEKHNRFPKDISNPPCCDVTLLFPTFPKLEKLWMILRMLFHLSGVPHLHVNRPLLSSSLKDISRENIFQVLKKILWTFSRYSSFFLLWLRSRLIQVAYVTSLGCLCTKYITAASIQVCSSRSMLFFSIFCLYSIEFQKENLKNTRENLRPRRYPLSFREPRFYRRRV